MKRLLVGWLFVATSFTYASERAKVGLALGGGSARGIAHVGVLEWLEENQIPVDFVAGTSMGGLVGGAFATGMSGAEIRTFLRDTDWDLVFLGEAPYALKSFRRKQDRRNYPVKLEIGLRGGVKFPSGLDPAHQIGLLLSRIALPYSELADFDQLPTPFRSVATDMRSSEVVVLADGSLSQALLATMAIPGMFPPVQRDGRILSDGGLLDNVPADVVARERVDIVIAVDVGAVTDAGNLDSALTAASQAIDVMMAASTRRSLESADLVITPDVRGVGSFDWRRSDDIADRGYAAAEAHRSVLEAYRLDGAEWADYQQRRRSKRRFYDHAPAFVEVSGVDELRRARLEKQLSPFVGVALAFPEWHDELTAITGTERYESLRYEGVEREGAHGLLVPTKEKSYAPPLLRFNVGLSNETQDIDFNFGARLVALDVGKAGAEVRAQGDIGARLGAGVEYYYPIVGRTVFVAPRAFTFRSYISEFDNDNLIASRRDRRSAIGVDLGLTTLRNSELRLGYQLGDIDSSIRVGDPELPQLRGREEFFRARFVYDGHNAPMIPTRGARLVSSIKWYEDAPGAQRAFGVARADLSAFVPRGDNDVVYLLGSVGAALGAPLSFLYDLGLGGPFQLSSFELDEFRGDNLLYGSLGYLREVSRLPDVLGGPVYITGLVEAGSAFDDFDAAEYRFSAGGGIVIATALGPMYAIVSGGSDGNVKFYFTLGRFFTRNR